MRFAKSQYKGRDLVVLAHDKQVHQSEGKDGKTYTRHYLDIQVDARDLREGETAQNLHLETRTDKEGKVSNGLPYSPGQLEQIAKIAGDNKQDILDKDGNVIGTAYGVSADIMIKSNNKGVKQAYINTKTLGEASQTLPENVKSAQIEAMKGANPEVAEEVKEEAPKAKAKKAPAKKKSAKAKEETEVSADELVI